MIKTMFFQIIKNRLTILIIFVFVIASLYDTYQVHSQYAGLALELKNPAEDLNIEAATRILAESKTLTYYSHFIYVSEVHDLAVFALLAYVGILLSSRYCWMYKQDTEIS